MDILSNNLTKAQIRTVSAILDGTGPELTADESAALTARVSAKCQADERERTASRVRELAARGYAIDGNMIIRLADKKGMILKDADAVENYIYAQFGLIIDTRYI